MSLFSSFRKNKQEASAEDSAYFSRAESESSVTRPRKRKSSSRAGAEGDKAPVDPVLPEKKRARRRLVGAIALVLAVVIGLPMVLDSEPKPLADDVTIEIPSKDKPVAPARTAPVPTQTPAAVPKAGAADAGSRVATVAALDPKEEVVQMPVTQKAAAPVTSSTLPAPAKKPESVPLAASAASKPEPALAKPKTETAKPKMEPAAVAVNEKSAKSEHSEHSEHSEKSADTARAKAILEAGPDLKPAKYTVQVAALASTEKVNELRGKLKDAGITSYTQKIATDSGERIRIRIGPLGSREEADKLRAKLSALGLNGTLVPSSL